MTKYKADCALSAETLTSGIIEMLEGAGFARLRINGTDEVVYERAIENRDRMRVRVYTSLDWYDDKIRPRYVGEDSIKIITLYTSLRDGETRGIAKAKRRIYRVGDIDDILNRMLEGMRYCYRIALVNPHLCPKCGSPMFKTKKTKFKPSRIVCAEICWTQPKKRKQ